MTEAQVSFLYNIAATLSQSGDNYTKTILKSYYLMRCQNVTGEHNLPKKLVLNSCPKCCIGWKRNTSVKVRSKKLSKGQRRRIKSHKLTKKDVDTLSNTNEIVKVCTFCNNSTITTALKPKRVKLRSKVKTPWSKASDKDIMGSVHKKSNSKLANVHSKKMPINVYSNAIDVFSLKNKNNTLASTIKQQPKIIKNNKKKKDKYAGLCQKAVLASAKIKEDKLKQNILNLFLQPASI